MQSHGNDFFQGYEGGVSGISCNGDSGGPLVIFNSRDRQYFQVGIVSGGSCGSMTDPSVFVRLENREVLEFITENALVEATFNFNTG